MKWGSQQQQALDMIGEWWRNPDWSVEDGPMSIVDAFTLDGYAGTGKTTIAKELPGILNTTVSYAAYTGKAAAVLRSKGMKDATTLHSLLFRPRERNEEREALERELESAPQVHRARIAERLLELQDTVDFTSGEPPASIGQVLVVDERSMIDVWMLERIAERFRRVIFLGDPFQLKPVRGEEAPIFPNFELTEVHRHAGPLLEAVTRIRQGDSLWDVQNEVFQVREGSFPGMSEADVLLCHRNQTRKAANKRQRERGGHVGRPRAGEPMVILKNDHAKDLWNGEVWKMAEDAEILDDVTLGVRLEGRPHQYEAERARFQPEAMQPLKKMQEIRAARKKIPIEDYTEKAPLQMDYGYSLTVHKSQGSEWPVVGLIHDYRGARDVDWRRWLYTACTRARERVMVAMT